MIQQTFQQYASLKEDDCMIKFFETLKDFVSYDEEVFPCELVVSSNLTHRGDPKVVFLKLTDSRSLFLSTFIQHFHFSTARLEFVGGAGRWWERHSTAHTEECSGRHGRERFRFYLRGSQQKGHYVIWPAVWLQYRITAKKEKYITSEQSPLVASTLWFLQGLNREDIK